MATAKKTPVKIATKASAKKVVEKASNKPSAAPKIEERTFSMPVEVQEWIERASSTMKHQANQIATLKEELAQLKAYKKFATNKIQGMSYE
jgi:hypothetical protein